MIQSIPIPYGEQSLTIHVPDHQLMGVFKPHETHQLPDVNEILQNAIENPIGTPRLAEIAKPDQKCVIIADDKTRPTPVSRILPLIMKQLNLAGVPDENIAVVFALGTHVPMTESEMRLRMGSLADRIRFYNSEFRNPAGLKDMGIAPGGVRVEVDKRVAQADLRIGVGSIMPHPECGWGGGGKIIYPGVASEKTVETFHLSYSDVHWNCYGSSESPVRLNMEKWVDNVGLDFIVNTVITADNQVFQAVAGHYVEAHRKGIEYGREIYSVNLPARADIVVITSFRADDDFWMASKAIFAGDLVIEDGGVMILITPCPDGIGPHPAYADYIGTADIDRLAQDARNRHSKEPVAIASALAVAKMKKRYSIAIVSDGILSETAERMKCMLFHDPDNALAWALEQKGKRATVAVLPYGISTLPSVSKGP